MEGGDEAVKFLFKFLLIRRRVSDGPQLSHYVDVTNAIWRVYYEIGSLMEERCIWVHDTNYRLAENQQALRREIAFLESLYPAIFFDSNDFSQDHLTPANY